MTKPRLTFIDVAGYGLGDAANNIVFAMGTMFLLYYYTDVARIDAAAVGTMLLVVRVFDAIVDIAAGRVVDQTMTRHGRFRPFLLWGTVPLAALNALVFSVPAEWTSSQKLSYAYATYALLGIAYSFVNIPYGSLATVMTQQSAERARLGTSRAFFAVLTFSFLILAIGPGLRGTAADLQSMYTRYTVILGVLCVVFHLLCFKMCRELIHPSVEKPRFSDSVLALKKNKPLFLLCFSAVCVLAASLSMNASTLFYARYILGDTKQFMTIIMTTALVGTLVAAPLVPSTVTRIGKKQTFLLGCGLGLAGFFILFLVPPSHSSLVYCAFGLSAIGILFSTTVMWALEADTVEYGEWTTGVRIEGLTYALFSFTRKCGQAIGGSIPAYLLASSGYVPNEATTDATRTAILCAVALVPAGFLILAFAAMRSYPLTDERYGLLLEEINARRDKAKFIRQAAPPR